MLANESRVAVPLHNQALSALLYATSMRAYTCLCDRIEASRSMSALGRMLSVGQSKQAGSTQNWTLVKESLPPHLELLQGAGLDLDRCGFGRERSTQKNTLISRISHSCPTCQACHSTHPYPDHLPVARFPPARSPSPARYLFTRPRDIGCALRTRKQVEPASDTGGDRSSITETSSPAARTCRAVSVGLAKPDSILLR